MITLLCKILNGPKSHFSNSFKGFENHIATISFANAAFSVLLMGIICQIYCESN